MKKKTNLEYGEHFNPYKIDTYAPVYNCILQSDLKDAAKLLLGKLYQYGGKNGEAHPKRKTLAADLGWSLSKLDKAIASLKKSGLISTEKTGCHSSSEFTFFYHEIYDASNTKTEPKSRKILNKKITLKPETIELIAYWNSFENLTTHKLEGTQTQTVQDLDSAIYKLLHGTYYTDHKEAPLSAKKPFRIEQIKKAIDRMAVASGPDYYEGKQRMSFLKFIHNPRMSLGAGRDRYRYKYPLLYFMNNTPKPLSKKHTKKTSENNVLTNRLIEKITGSKAEYMDGADYNKVLKYVDKSVAMIKTFKPTGGDIPRYSIPDLIYDSLEECGKGKGIGQLGLAVSHLEEMMKRRLIIK